MNYTLKYFETEGEKEDIVFDFGEEHSLISLFLSGECDLLDTFLGNIDLVLSNKYERAEVRGNICFVEIHKDMSRVEFLSIHLQSLQLPIFDMGAVDDEGLGRDRPVRISLVSFLSPKEMFVVFV